jgi:hypothetical protein
VEIKADKLKQFIGMDVTQLPDKSITISAETKLNAISLASNKLNPERKGAPNPASIGESRALDVDMACQTELQSRVGQINWINQQVPFACYQLSILASETSRPGTEKVRYAEQLLRFLIRHKHTKLHYRQPVKDSLADQFPLQVYADASYPTDHSMGRGGFWVLFFGCPVMWRTTSVKAASASVEQAEWKAARDAMLAAEGLRLVANAILRYFGEEHTIHHMRIWEDNLNVVNKFNAPRFTATKKLYMAHYISAVREFNGAEGTDECKLSLAHVKTSDQLADCLTKHFDLPTDEIQHLLYSADDGHPSLPGGRVESVVLAHATAESVSTKT